MWHSTVLVLSVALGLASVQAAPGTSSNSYQHIFPNAPTRRPYDYCQAGYLDPYSYPIPEVKGAVLAHVQVLIRHGDRGQLTSIGARQHQRLGQVLKAVYIDQLSLLNKTLDPDTVYFRSSDYPRTKQSAESLLRGLFAKPHTNALSEDDNNTLDASLPPVVELHYYPSQIDTFFKNAIACPAIRHLEKKIFSNSKVLQTLIKTNVEFKKDLVRIFGADTTLPDWNPKRADWASFVDVVHARLCHDLPMQCEPGTKPEEDDGPTGGAGTKNKKNPKKDRCVTQQMIERIQDNAEIYAAATRRDGKDMQKLMRLVAGPLVADLRRGLVQARHKGPVRFTLFSGHDDTVTTMLGVLKSKDIRWPPYASNLLFELWKVPCEHTFHGCGSTEDDDYYVRVFYNGAVVDADWCDLNWCPYEKFIDYLDTYIPEDFHAECHAKDEL
ncbi:hypothetical protein BGZ73_001411 [Actinomortierella ambigua]|nr:hypothetical protein BGZ73_001411 [Actinomortierella ambigua]